MRFKKPKKLRYILFFFLVLLVLLTITIPNRSGILKAVGFWDKEWIVSTSGALFETQNLAFTAKVGDANNPSNPIFSYEINGKHFSLTPIQKSSPPKLATPSSEIVSTNETASLDAQIKQLNENIALIESDVSKMSGSTDQTFFGPHETIRQNNVENAFINYYIFDNKLVQEWQVISDVDRIQILFQSADLTLRINEDQSWFILDGDTPIAKIDSKVLLKDKTVATLPTSEKKTLTTTPEGTVVDIALPNDVQLLTRTITPLANAQISSLDLPHIPTTQDPQYITTFGTNVLVGDPQEKSVSVISNATNTIVISPIDIVGIACLETSCYAATPTELLEFSPDLLLQELDPEKKQKLIKHYDHLGQTISSMTANTNQLFLTTDANPNGKIISWTPTTSFSDIRTDLVYPNKISTNTNIEVVENASQIEYKTAKDWSVLQLPQKLTHFTTSKDGFIYGILFYDRTKSDIVIRINPESSVVEVLAKVTGAFTGLTVQNDTLYLGMPNQVLTIDLRESHWITTKEFSSNLPL